MYIEWLELLENSYKGYPALEGSNHSVPLTLL